MRYLSLFSGIEAATVAWRPLQWEAAAFAEVAPFQSAVLAYHYPEVPNLGDVTKIHADELKFDLLVGGSPCQDLSIAGSKLGVKGEKSGLIRELIRIAAEALPRWFLWENVPGAISSNRGEDFSTFISTLTKIGYCCGWVCLRADRYGVPQRRERLFVVGLLGGGSLDHRPSTFLHQSRRKDC